MNLDKIPTSKIYDDLLSSGFKKVGNALSTVLELSNTILLPIKLVNERSKMVFDNNMRKYEQKLNNVNSENIASVPEYIGIPILDKLTYLTEENISNAFINLLSKASTNKTLKLVHPSFLAILNDLSSDEAKILFGFKDLRTIPSIELFLHREKKVVKTANPKDKGTIKHLDDLINDVFQNTETSEIRIAWNLTGIEFEMELDFPENIDIYLNNLERLKIIEFNNGIYTKSNEDKYKSLEKKFYKPKIDEFNVEFNKMMNEPGNDLNLKVVVKRGMIVFTDYGKLFLKACMNEIE